MSAPIEFYRTFCDLLSARGISCCLTSGMACVEYGLQQTTKDTDWILPQGQEQRLTELFVDLERGLQGKNWRIAYRFFFGAPLRADYLAGGWSSHLCIRDAPASPEHYLDFFGRPPRVAEGELAEIAALRIAPRLLIASMKKTDRDKDWPMVEALSLQAAEHGFKDAILHLRDPAQLPIVWQTCTPEEKERFLRERPLLAELDERQVGLERSLACERFLWENVNRQRFSHYQSAWKDFYRRWQAEADSFAWPSSASFQKQHEIVCLAADRHGLLLDPLTGSKGRQRIVADAKQRAAEIFGIHETLMARICPPAESLLP